MCIPLPKPAKEPERHTPVPFRGESTTQAEYKAPPPDAVKASFVNYPVPSIPAPRQTSFEGQSSAHCDYRPPPLDAFRQRSEFHAATGSREAQPKIPFLGVSSTHADYAAPPASAFADHASSADLPVRQSIVPNLVHPSARLEPVSTTHHDFQPPSLELLRQALLQTGIEEPPSALPRPKFEGESCAHRDFKPPPSVIPVFRTSATQGAPGVQELLQPAEFAASESTTHHDYRAPPLESRHPPDSVSDERCPMPRTRFQGESTTQADYKAPPLDAMKLSMADCQGPTALASDSSAKFEGQSRTHADFQPPPLEALRLPNASLPVVCSELQPKIPFLGVSSTHADYAAPPASAFADHASSADLPVRQSIVPDLVHPSARLEPVSTTHHDFQPPSLELLRQALLQTGIEETPSALPRPKFEGESCAHRDFKPPPSVIPVFRTSATQGAPGVQELLQPTGFAASESTTHHDYRAPPLESRHPPDSVSDERCPMPRTRFQGESTTQADYKAPPLDAMKLSMADCQGPTALASDSSAKFEGQSRTHADFQPPPLESLMLSLKAEVTGLEEDASKLTSVHSASFEGVSTTHHDFPRPPMEAYRREPSKHGRDHQDIFSDPPPLQNLWEWLSSAEQHTGPEPEPQQAKHVHKAKQDSSSQTGYDHQVHAAGAGQHGAGHHGAGHHGAGHHGAGHHGAETETGQRAVVRFEGESSMQLHYQAPPLDALRSTTADIRSRQEEMQHSSVRAARFEGESTAHRDFQAHSVHGLSDVQRTSLDERSFVNSLPFEGESSMRAHYQAPPPEALRITSCDAQSQRHIELQHASGQAAKFEGESTAHSHFRAYPGEAMQFVEPSTRSESAGPAAPFEGESSMRAHYKAPPMDALMAFVDVRSRHGDLQHSSVEAAKFEGESTSHRDFQAHAVHGLSDVQHMSLDDRSLVNNLPFEGESSMRAHYQAPPPEALRITSCDAQSQRQIELQHASGQAAKFEGESAAHSDFRAYPREAMQFAEPSTRSESVGPAAAFEGESSMRAHYKPPPLDALVASMDVRSRHGDLQHSSVEAAKFEGESTAHRDFQAPAPQDLSDVQCKSLDDRSLGNNLPFEGESSMRAHYQPPPLEALRITSCDAQQRQLELQHASGQAAKFEGESTAHSDFRAYPREAMQFVEPSTRSESVGPAAPFEGESSMRAQYKPPPLDALMASMDVRSRHGDLQHSSVEAAKFEGESTAHRDFQAPAPQDLSDVQCKSLDDRSLVNALPFEGESSMRAHYQPPPLEALRITSCDAQQRQLELQHASGQAAKFEGESTAHSDFRAYPREAMQFVEPSTRSESVGPAAPFEGESSMRAQYKPPPLDALMASMDVRSRHGDLQHSSVEAAKFEGESTAHRDFQAPAPQDLSDVQRKSLDDRSLVNILPFEGESSMRAHYQAPPPEALRITPGDVQPRQLEAVKFEGESTAHSDFRAYPREAMQFAEPSTRSESVGPAAAFEGESSMRAHYKPPPLDALVASMDVRSRHGDLQHSSVEAAKFEGESTAHRDFQAPAPQDLSDVQRKSLDDRSLVNNLPFEGESSMRAHYQPPPLEALRIKSCEAQQSRLELQHASGQAAKFEGESTAHSDFRAYPREAMQFVEPSTRSESVGPAAPFEGESSMRAHYRAPPLDALKTSVDAPLRQGAVHPVDTAKFEGESTARRDYQAHAVQDLPGVHRTSLEERSLVNNLPFEGESSMRAHYQAPPPEALRGTPCDVQPRQLEAVKFEGESTAHSDFRAYPREALQFVEPSARSESVGPAAPFEGESSMRAHYRAPPLDALKTAFCKETGAPQADLCHNSQQVPFMGESTTHHDYQAPALPMLLGVPRAHQAAKADFSVPFKGESSMRAHYQPPPPEAFLPRAWPTTDVNSELRTSFDGESSMRAHYQAPSPEALRSAACQQPTAGMPSVRNSPKFEGESTAHRDFKAPALQALLHAGSTAAPLEGALHQEPSAACGRDGPAVETLLQILASGDGLAGDAKETRKMTDVPQGPEEPTTQGFKVPSLDKLRAILHEAEACCASETQQNPKPLSTWPAEKSVPGHPGGAPDLRRPAGRASSSDVPRAVRGRMRPEANFQASMAPEPRAFDGADRPPERGPAIEAG